MSLEVGVVNQFIELILNDETVLSDEGVEQLQKYISNLLESIAKRVVEVVNEKGMIEVKSSDPFFNSNTEVNKVVDVLVPVNEELKKIKENREKLSREITKNKGQIAELKQLRNQTEYTNPIDNQIKQLEIQNSDIITQRDALGIEAITLRKNIEQNVNQFLVGIGNQMVEDYLASAAYQAVLNEKEEKALELQQTKSEEQVLSKERKQQIKDEKEARERACLAALPLSERYKSQIHLLFGLIFLASIVGVGSYVFNLLNDPLPNDNNTSESSSTSEEDVVWITDVFARIYNEKVKQSENEVTTPQIDRTRTINSNKFIDFESNSYLPFTFPVDFNEVIGNLDNPRIEGVYFRTKYLDEAIRSHIYANTAAEGNPIDRIELSVNLEKTTTTPTLEVVYNLTILETILDDPQAQTFLELLEGLSEDDYTKFIEVEAQDYLPGVDLENLTVEQIVAKILFKMATDTVAKRTTLQNKLIEVLRVLYLNDEFNDEELMTLLFQTFEMFQN